MEHTTPRPKPKPRGKPSRAEHPGAGEGTTDGGQDKHGSDGAGVDADIGHPNNHEGFHYLPLRKYPRKNAEYNTAPLEHVEPVESTSIADHSDEAQRVIDFTVRGGYRERAARETLVQREIIALDLAPRNPNADQPEQDTRVEWTEPTLAAVAAAAEVFPECVKVACRSFGLSAMQYPGLGSRGRTSNVASRFQIVNTERFAVVNPDYAPEATLKVQSAAINPTVDLYTAGVQGHFDAVQNNQADLVDNAIMYHRLARVSVSGNVDVGARNVFHPVLPQTIKELAKFTIMCDQRRWEYTAKAAHVEKATKIAWNSANHEILGDRDLETTFEVGHDNVDIRRVLRRVQRDLERSIAILSHPESTSAEREQALGTVSEMLPKGIAINQDEWSEGSVDTVRIDKAGAMSEYAKNRDGDGETLQIIDAVHAQSPHFKPIFDALIGNSLKSVRIALDLQHAYADMAIDMVELCRVLDIDPVLGAVSEDDPGNVAGISILSNLTPEIKARFDADLEVARDSLEKTKRKLQEIGEDGAKAKLDELGSPQEILQWGAPYGLFNGTSYLFHHSLIALAYGAPEEFRLDQALGPNDPPNTRSPRNVDEVAHFRIPRAIEEQNWSQKKLDILFAYGRSGGIGKRDLMSAPSKPWASWGSRPPSWAP